MIVGASPGIFNVLAEVAQPKQTPAEMASKLMPLILSPDCRR